jgi:integrase/recombinase XerD
MTFPEAVQQFGVYLLTARGRSRATIENYTRDLTQFAEDTKVAELAALDRTAVLAWLTGLTEREHAPRTRARKLSALRSFVQWAMEYGHLQSDPIPADVANPRALYLPYALTEGEVLSILRAAGSDDDPALQGAEQLRDLAMLEVLYAGGLRVSELCGLTIGALQLGEGFVIVTGKGNKQRLVPLGQAAVESVRTYLAGARAKLCPRADGHDEVFLTSRGPVSRSYVFRRVRHYAALAGVTRAIGPHTFRHSCASHLLAHGADLRLVQELLGHASLVTTQVYTHIEKGRLRSVYDQCHPLAR